MQPEVIEQFTFRSGGKAVTCDAVIDTGATSTVITQSIVEALELQVIGEADAYLAGGRSARTTRHRCVIAWSIYEAQGFYSEHEVICLAAGGEVLIGFDFLSRHELKVDLANKGLIGTAPDAAIPLTGGGYVLNPPRGLVQRMNFERAQAARPGEVLRPHPAWRFRIPTIVKDAT